MRIIVIMLLGLTALVVAIILAILQYRRQGNWAEAARVGLARFIGLWYGLAAIDMLFKLETIWFKPRGISNPFAGNYVPLRTILAYLRVGNVYQLAGNAFALLPLPLLLRWNFPGWKYRRYFMIALGVGVVIEPLQILVNVIMDAKANVIDVDDLLLNVMGCLVGLLVLWLVMRRRVVKAGG